MIRKNNFATLVLGTLAATLSVLSAADKDINPQSDNRLLNNIDTLKAATAKPGKLVPVETLKAELASLWDWQEQGQRPLKPEVVFSETKNGIKVEGVYFDGYGDEHGQDRVFAYFGRPEKAAGNIPAYIEITGGGDVDACRWMAGKTQCAVLNLEWRRPGSRFRSKWAAGSLATSRELTSLKANTSFRVVCAIRRAIDFLASQPGIDMAHVGCGGGSMGGYYTLLAAGVDDRIHFGMDELGAGFLADTDSQRGQLDLDPERKQIWLAAFDPYSYAARTKASILMNLSANDFFFWTGDALRNYEALAGDKRLNINPNFNHNAGAFGRKKHNPMNWLPYGSGHEPSYPQITGSHQDGPVYTVTSANDAAIQEAVLCWSPGGEHVPWPARYWAETPAVKTAGGWRAEVPARYAALARRAFMTLTDARGCSVSSEPVFTAGDAPEAVAGPLWAENQLWDAATGTAAWRLVGPNVHPGADDVTLTGEGPHGFTIHAEGSTFALVTNSVVLASGQAKNHHGLEIELSGNGSAGELVVSLVRNFGAVQGQQEFKCSCSYEPGEQVLKLPWADFKNAPGRPAELLPFDSLRLDGKGKSGLMMSIRAIRFLE